MAETKAKTDFKINISHEDFSPKAINKALINHTVGHWSFRYSAIGVLLTLLAIPLFGFSQTLFGILLASFGTIATSFIWNYIIKSESFVHQHVEKLQELILKQTDDKRTQLKHNLHVLNSSAGVQQLEDLQEKFDNLIEVLGSKFDSGELAYKRYYGISQEVFLSAIDNLSMIVLSLKSVEQIDVDYIKKRLEKLGNSDSLEIEEKETLQKRLALYNETQRKIRELLTENEKALTLITETTIAITKIDVNDNEGKIDMENSMKAMAELIKSSQEFSV